MMEGCSKCTHLLVASNLIKVALLLAAVDTLGENKGNGELVATISPTFYPAVLLTDYPTHAPVRPAPVMDEPTHIPTEYPTPAPVTPAPVTDKPTPFPTEYPTNIPTASPTASPTLSPTESPHCKPNSKPLQLLPLPMPELLEQLLLLV
jgi:hypothetical protein